MLIGKKLGMMQLYEESGKATTVSVIEAGPCPIVQVKTPEKEGYAAVQIGFGPTKESRTTSPMRGHFAKAGVGLLRVLREWRLDEVGEYKVGDVLDVKVFEGAKKVDVTGLSKGRGFAGTIKRYNFQRGRKTHGNKNYREPGSVGNAATPKRIYKGRRLPGRLGGGRCTARNVEVVQIDAENNLLFVKGSIPGANNGIVFIKTAQR